MKTIKILLVTMITLSQSMAFATDFSCNFETSTDADKWNIISIVSTGSWAVTSGSFGNVFNFNRGTASGTENVISAKDVTMTDGIVSSDIILHEKSIGGAASGILFHYVDASNYYMLRMHCSQLKLQLYKRIGGTFALLKETGLTAINVDQVYNLKAKVEGENITCYLDNVEKLTATDNALTSGTIGFRIYDQSVSLDNVLITPVGGTTAFYPTKETDTSVIYNVGEQAISIKSDMVISEINVFDVSGSLVQKIAGGTSESKIYVSTWNNGIYMVRINTLKGEIVKKIVKF